MTVKNLLKEAKKLSLEEREKLADGLIANIEAEYDDEPLSEDLKAELTRRIDAYEKNPTRGSTVGEVDARIRAKLKKVRKK
jgi:putative addiction module component (TIGR02574 family)